jgi:hypothetical protein
MDGACRTETRTRSLLDLQQSTSGRKLESSKMASTILKRHFIAKTFFLIAMFVIVEPVLVHSDENLLLGNPDQKCARMAHEASCACSSSELTPMTGGVTNIQIFMPPSGEPLAQYSSGPSGYCARSAGACYWNAFNLKGNEIQCRDFFVFLQNRQRDCGGCLISKTFRGI